MYLHLGQSTVVKAENIIGIFDIDNTTVSKHTRDYLSRAEKDGRVVYVCDDLPKSFITMQGGTVYISQLAPSTLYKRFAANEIGESIVRR